MSDEQPFIDAFRQADSSETPAAPVEPSAPAEIPQPAPESTPQEKSPVQLDDDVPVEFKVGGQVIRKAWKEILQTQAMLPADYTRKLQALGSERQTFQQERSTFDSERQAFEQTKAAILSAIRDPKKLEALYVAAMSGQPQGQPQAAPTPQAIDPVQLQQHFLSQAEQLINQRFQSMEAERTNVQHADVLEKHVEKILAANPALKALPNVNDYLYGQVVGMVEPGKTSVQEATALLDTVAQAVAGSLNQHFVNSKKESSVQSAQLKNGIEPKGGSPVMPSPKQYDRKKGLDDPDLEQDVIAYMKAQLGGA